jgi:Flp pilus assembly protein CpaB
MQHFHDGSHAHSTLIYRLEKGSGTFCAKHPPGRSGKRFPTPFPADVKKDEWGGVLSRPGVVEEACMKIRTALLLVVAVICGTAGSRMSKRLFSQQPVEERVVVFVARDYLPAGTVLREPETLFEETTLPKDQEPENAVRHLGQLKGRRLGKPLKADEVVTAGFLVEEVPEGVAILKKEGRQAVAIVVRESAGFLLLPDSRVDVICTANGGQVVAQKLLILGIDGGADRQTVTLAATAEEATRLRQAATQGALRLVLRSPE